MNSELDEKTQRITAMLSRERLDAVLLSSQHNFAWLTGGGSNGVDLSRENGIATLLITREGKRFVLASLIEIDRMFGEEVAANDFDRVDYSWQDEKRGALFVLEKARSVLMPGTAIASDVPMGKDVPSIENKIAKCRYALTENETERFRDLGRDAGRSLRAVIDRLEPGETELQIAEKMRHELSKKDIASVVTLVAADERISGFRHPIPSANRWQKTLLIVTCAKRYGLIASLSRMICVGRVPDELKARTDAAAYVYAKMLDSTRPGQTGADIYQTAASAYSERGFADEIDRHHQGGAAGYRTRDWVAHPASEDIVTANQAFAWNPSITGTKVEETCIVTERGIEIITASPDFPQILNVVNGREYLSPGILTI
ncbi:MAG: M24 family metallopeptidase [Acidobacteriota bacterium]